MATREQQRTVRAQRDADAWNNHVTVGDLVEYRGHPEALPEVFKAATEASVLSGHTAVLWLEKKSGCVAVSACRKTGE